MAKRDKSNDARRLLAGQATADALVRALQRVNPTGRGLSAHATARRYELKSALQSRLLRDFAQAVEIRPEPGSDEIVVLTHRTSGRSAGHAVVSELDDEARLVVRRALSKLDAPTPDAAGADRAAKSGGCADPFTPPVTATRSSPQSALAAGSEALASWDYDTARACFEQAHAAGLLGGTLALIELLVDHLCDDQAVLDLDLSADARVHPQVRILRALSAARSGQPDAWRAVRDLHAGRVVEVWAELGQRAIRDASVDEMMQALRALECCEERDPSAEHALRQALDTQRAAREQAQRLRWEEMLARGLLDAVEAQTNATLRGEPDHRAARATLERVERLRQRARVDALVAKASLVETAHPAEALRLLSKATDLGARGLEERVARLRRRCAERGAAQRVGEVVDALCASGPTEASLARLAQLDADERRACLERLPWPVLQWMEQGRGSARRRVQAALALRNALRALEDADLDRAEESLRRSRALDASADHQRARRLLTEGRRQQRIDTARDSLSEAMSLLDADPQAVVEALEALDCADLPHALSASLDALLVDARLRHARRRREQHYQHLVAAGRHLDAARLAARSADRLPAERARWLWRQTSAEQAAASPLKVRLVRGSGERLVRPVVGLRSSHPAPHPWVTGDGEHLMVSTHHDDVRVLSLLKLPEFTEISVLTISAEGLFVGPPVVCGQRVWVGVDAERMVEIDLVRGTACRVIALPAVKPGHYAHPSLVVSGDRAWACREGPAECFDLTHDRALNYLHDIKQVVAHRGTFLALTKDNHIVELRDQRSPLSLGAGRYILAITRDDRGAIALAGQPDAERCEMLVAGFDGRDDARPEMLTLQGADPTRQYQLASDGTTTWVLATIDGTPSLLGLDLIDRSALRERYRTPVPDDSVLVSGAEARIGLLWQSRDGLRLVWLGSACPDLPPCASPATFPLREELVCHLDLVDANPALRTFADALEMEYRQHENVARSLLAEQPSQAANILQAMIWLDPDVPEDLLARAEELAPTCPSLQLELAHRDVELLHWRQAQGRLQALHWQGLSRETRRHYHHLCLLAHSWLGELEQARAAYLRLGALPGPCAPEMEVLDALDQPSDPLFKLTHTLLDARTLDALGAPEVWQANEVQTILRRGHLLLDAWEAGDVGWLQVFLGMIAVLLVPRHLLGSVPSPDAIEGQAIDELVRRCQAWLTLHHRTPERQAALLLDEVQGTLRVRYRLSYDGQQPGDGPWVEGARDVLRRDLLWEQAVAEAFVDVFGSEQAFFEGDAALDFLSDQLPELAQTWAVLGRDTLLRYRLAPPLEPRVGQQGLSLVFTTANRQIAGLDAVAAWLAGIRYIRLDDGSLARLPEAWMRRHAQASQEVLTQGDLPHLVFCRGQLRGDDLAPPLLRRPPGLRARLRPYQRQGWSWLAHRRDLGVGCVLADDMGLGKTVQAIAVLLDTHRRHDDARPSLLVVPTSVLGNWCEEVARFAPELFRKLAVYHGPGRQLPSGEAVVLTTPGVVRADIERLQRVDWRYLVLDEAQQVKNPKSQLAVALRSLHAAHRLALTGTPIENHIEELWSLFALIEPGLLGSRAGFLQRYEADLSALHRRVAPFVLRRRKEAVATDLPPRQTMVLRCVLSDAEREVYDTVCAGASQALAGLPDGVSPGPIVLNALLRLRQACCHPKLLGDMPVVLPGSSAKLELLVERLERAIDSGHRSLVFSQWTGMLDLVQRRIEALGWAYLRLDGRCSAEQRTERVRAWSKPSGPPIFLLSLKAGGVGLNLTAADHVMFLDPWWNPAAEAQARDRAHRIGQTRPVMIYKLIAADTVEDRILGMQARKRQLFREVVDGLAPGQLDLSQLTDQQLVALL